MDQTDSSNCKSIKPIEVEDKKDANMDSEDFRTDLCPIIAEAIHLEEGQGMDKIVKVDQGMI